MAKQTLSKSVLTSLLLSLLSNLSILSMPYDVNDLQGLAQMMGQFLMLFQCSPKSDGAALGKTLQGMVMVRSTFSVQFSDVIAINSMCNGFLPLRMAAGDVLTTLRASIAMESPFSSTTSKQFLELYNPSLISADLEMVKRSVISAFSVMMTTVLMFSFLADSHQPSCELLHDIQSIPDVAPIG